jgi:hypothetical protein
VEPKGYDMNIKTIGKIIFISMTAISAWALYDVTQIINDLGITLSLRWALIIANFALITLSGVVVLAAHFLRGFRLPDPILFTADFPRLSNPFYALTCFLVSILFALTPVLHPYYGNVFFDHLGLRSFVFLIAFVLCAQSFRLWTKRAWDQSLAFALILIASIYRIAATAVIITDYPFSLAWTETTRYYTASLIFSKLVYGEFVRWTFLLPTYSIVLAPPHLIPGLPLWAHRLWLVIVTIGLTLWTSYALMRRLKIESRLVIWMMSLWGMLFLFQGPIYIYLLISAIIVLYGYKCDTPLKTYHRSLFAFSSLLIASFWAGMSRITWFPVPAILMIGLYVIETPLESAKDFWRYIRKPIVWGVVGVVTAFIGQLFFVWVSGNELSSFYTSASSDLLWYRLLPNPTLATGVLLGSVIVSIPLALVLGRGWIDRSRWHPIQIAILALALIGLLALGILVSAKIGGGGDLHNLDAYLILIMIVGAYVFIKQEKPSEWITLAVILIPVALALIAPKPIFAYDRESAQKTLASIRSEIAKHDGEVLMISERHLIPFGMVETQLVPEYEKDELIEMAMAANFDDLNTFYADLEAHRFALIVSDPQKIQLFDDSYGWGKENNTWVRKIAIPMLCEYAPLIVYPEGIALYVPRETRECPEVK